MKAVHKFVLDQRETTVQMARGGQPLTVQLQERNYMPGLVLWALCDPSAPLEERRFIVAMTGEGLPDAIGAYVGTVQHATGIVAHVFEAGGASSGA